MARGNDIVLPVEPRGVFLEGLISGTPKPGTIVQIKNTALVNGRPTFEAFNRAADGDRGIIAVLDADRLQGKLATDAYADGDRCFVYCPVAGEELNVLKLDVAGTGDDFTIGQYLIVDDGTGKVLGTTGSPQSEPFVAMEAITDPTADQLVHVMYTGQ